MSNYKKNVLMKKFTNKIFAALIAPMLAVGCIEEAFPEGATQVADQVGASEFALGGLVNSFPVAMMQVDTRDFYSKYGTHVDFGIPAIHLMTESMIEDFTIAGELGYYWFGAHFQNVAMGAQYIYNAYFWD